MENINLNKLEISGIPLMNSKLNINDNSVKSEPFVFKYNLDKINLELLSKFSKLESKLDKESFNKIKELIYKNIYNLP